MRAQPWRGIAALLLAIGCAGTSPDATDSDTEVWPQDDPFADLDALLDEYMQTDRIHGFALRIHDADGDVAYERVDGRCVHSSCPEGSPPFSMDLRTGTASSSKWVTSTTILAELDRQVKAGMWPSVNAALDHEVVDDLGCDEVRGPLSEITVRQLLAFTSGLVADHPCVNQTGRLHACACDILDTSQAAFTETISAQTRSAAHPPGQTFKYGSTHQAVAGAWAEQITGTSFDALYRAHIASPLAIQAEFRRPTNLSGSLQATPAEYADYVRALQLDSQAAQAGAPTQLLSRDALLQQRRNQIPAEAAVLSSTERGLFDYGLNTWRWCTESVTTEQATGPASDLPGFADPSCAAVFQLGHGGKGGYLPFMDAEGRYSAVFVTREDSPGAGSEYTVDESTIAMRIRMLTHLAMVPTDRG
ncbi:MAG: serine hydrolase domain-containing protein [Myxococcota bacterium]